MPKVYIPQLPRRRDTETDKFVPTVDISPALEYGTPVMLLPSNASFYAIGDLTDQLRVQMKAYNYEDGDSIIAIGDPAIIAVVVGMAAKLYGKFYILKWDRSISRYNKIKIIL
jgi:hypothetical protein